MLTSKQRAILRGKANTMDPVFIVGKGEIDETMIQGVKDCWQSPPAPTACRSSAPNLCSTCRRKRTALTRIC